MCNTAFVLNSFRKVRLLGPLLFPEKRGWNILGFISSFLFKLFFFFFFCHGEISIQHFPKGLQPRTHPKQEVLHVLPFSIDISLKHASSQSALPPSSVNSCTWPWTGVWGSPPKHLPIVTWIEFHKEGRDEQRCKITFLEESRIGICALNSEA